VSIDDSIKVTTGTKDCGRVHVTTLEVDELYLLQAFKVQVFEHAVRLIAERWAAEHYADIAAKLDPQAVANLAVAAAGAKINETLNKKMPDVVHEVVRTQTEREVWQRGVLGGLKRIG
jgi:hypothetical protein